MKYFLMLDLVLFSLVSYANEYDHFKNDYAKKISKYEFVVNRTTQVMTVYKDEEEISTHKVILGRPTRPTPLMETYFEWVKIHPEWVVPHTVAQDLVKKFRSKTNPTKYINYLGYFFLDWETKEKIAPETINWKKVDLDNIPFQIRQKPGPQNMLGDILFYLNTPNSVRMHSTAAPALFQRKDRYFSSGLCIRVEGIESLVPLVLGMDENDIQELMASTEEKWLKTFTKIVVRVTE